MWPGKPAGHILGGGQPGGGGGPEMEVLGGALLIGSPLVGLGLAIYGLIRRRWRLAGLALLGGFVAFAAGGALLGAAGKNEHAGSGAAVAPVSEISPERYEAECRKATEAEWAQRCKGKRIAWPMMVVKVEKADQIEARAFAVDRQLFDVILRRAASWPEPWPSYAGRKVVVTGVLKSPDGYAHDIGEATIAFAEPDESERRVIAAIEQKGKEDSARRERERQAVDLCKREFVARARHPSTVEWPTFDKFYGVASNQEEVIVRAGPKARNSFGNELRFEMLCRVKAGKVVAFAAEEAAP